MSHPKTLLELSGVVDTSVNWDNAALILIDFQIEYTNGSLALGDRAIECIDKARSLMHYAEGVKAPVVHVVQHGAVGSKLFNPAERQSHIVPELDVKEGEIIVVKHLPNAFANTNFEELLGLTGRNELVFAGFMSHMCVSSTVRAALDKGFKSFVCSDACYTRDLTGPDGDVLPAETVHQVSMAALRDRFGIVATAAEIMGIDMIPGNEIERQNITV